MAGSEQEWDEEKRIWIDHVPYMLQEACTVVLEEPDEAPADGGDGSGGSGGGAAAVREPRFSHMSNSQGSLESRVKRFARSSCQSHTFHHLGLR